MSPDSPNSSFDWISDSDDDQSFHSESIAAPEVSALQAPREPVDRTEKTWDVGIAICCAFVFVISFEFASVSHVPHFSFPGKIKFLASNFSGSHEFRIQRSQNKFDRNGTNRLRLQCHPIQDGVREKKIRTVFRRWCPTRGNGKS